MAWYWVVIIAIAMYLIGFFSAALAATSKRADQSSEQWVKSKGAWLILIFVVSSACTTVNCPPEAEEDLRAWALVEVLPSGKGTHEIELVVLQLIIDETERLSIGDTLEVFRALDLLEYQEANVILRFEDRWELEEILEE